VIGADKSLGQHFLSDKNVVHKITQDFAEQAKSIVEVGPGPGALTTQLALHPQKFFVIEKDRRFEDSLQELLGEENVILKDALLVNLTEELEKRELSEDVWLVSNLPYNVGVPLLMSFVKTPPVRWMSLMFQKEVALKVLNTAQKKNSMGSLMALTQTYFDVTLLCQVPPGAFRPPPKVDSSVLSFTRKENPVFPLERLSEFEKFLRTLYQFKRKQVTKNLKTRYEVANIQSALEMSSLSSTARAETFKLSEIHALFSHLHGVTLC
jgi:16S rRNA (adenine1518-N6/adenine1519-N6)-dimethyltransferase